MQKNTTGITPLHASYQLALRTKMEAAFADPDFTKGFESGIESFEEMCEDEGRALTAHEVNYELWAALDPAQREQDASVVEQMGITPRPLFDIGFLSGFLFAHWFTPAAPAAALPDTQPLPVIIPFRPRGQAQPAQAQPSSEHTSPLRYHRQLRGWSQRRLAEEIGTTEDVVSRWERGERKTSPYYCEKLCTVFQTTADKLGLM